MANQSQQNYYSNPAFCQQSEYYGSPQQRCKSPPKVNTVQRNHSIRQTPIGSLSKVNILDTSIHSIQNEPLPPKPGPKPTVHIEQNVDYDDEQEFYEEMILDDTGTVQEKKFVVVHNEKKNGNHVRYASIPLNEIEYVKESQNRNGNRYAAIPTEDPQKQIIKQRYEYIPLQEHERMKSPIQQRVQYQPEMQPTLNRVHRYAVIPSQEETAMNVNSGRYALVPVEEVSNKNRYAVITDNDLNKTNRYEYIEDNYKERIARKIEEPRTVISPQPIRRAGNPIATQKLHELLTTPKKIHRNSPRQLPVSPIQSASFMTPNRIALQNVQTPRAQQKLNYALSTRQASQDKRHTAIVQPICSSPVHSVYSETTISNKTESWMNLSMRRPPVQATLAVAAFMMIMCGGLSSGLCFYMISFMGRLYFLDFGIVAGFTCLLLGLLGFRSRNVYWLPNRNYISGYLILSVFSLLTCIGLLVLLFMQPKPGSPLADMTSGAVCGISALSLLLASTGIVASYCCKVPPPDNRVQHCAQGFVV